MNRDEFNKVINRRLSDINHTLVLKGAEYAEDNNVFHNFDRAAAVLNTHRTQALWGMYIKHHVSVDDMVNCRRGFDEPIVREKIGDMINYLILLEAMLTEDAVPF